jgi:uncharacterized membrane protein (DUF4010 family)
VDIFLHLGLALALGLLVGTERGWQARTAPEGSRIAGVRTFGLIGLLGGLWALLAGRLGETLIGFAFLALAALMIIAHVMDVQEDRDFGVTTTVAALVTFTLGAAAVSGYESIAAAGAVVTATVLSLKPVLHRWLQRLEPAEVFAAIKLLLISVVVLPVLPDRGLGPWGALNPYQIWWLVVLIAGISFAGYAAMKAVGPQRGILLTGLLGGMVSSTAATLNFSRLGERQQWHHLLAAGVLVASATMFPRILIEVAVVNQHLVASLALPLLLMTLTTAAGVWWLWRARAGDEEAGEFPLSNPFEIVPALQFGLLLAAITVLAEAFRAWLGGPGIYLLAGISGLADVDAITLSLARMARGSLDSTVATQAIVLAASVNTFVKAGLTFAIAGRGMGLRVAPPMSLAVAVGALVLLVA